jgi:hypothetical protein
MLGYYTVKLLGADRMAAADRMRLETAYAAQLEALAGGQPALMALCEAARGQPADADAQRQLRQAGRQAEAQVQQQAAASWPVGARFSLALWTVQDL